MSNSEICRIAALSPGSQSCHTRSKYKGETKEGCPWIWHMAKPREMAPNGKFANISEIPERSPNTRKKPQHPKEVKIAATTRGFPNYPTPFSFSPATLPYLYWFYAASFLGCLETQQDLRGSRHAQIPCIQNSSPLCYTLWRCLSQFTHSRPSLQSQLRGHQFHQITLPFIQLCCLCILRWASDWPSFMTRCQGFNAHSLSNPATSWYHMQDSISLHPWAEWWKTRHIHEQPCWHCSQSWDANVWRRGCKEWSYISSIDGILTTRNMMCSISMLHLRNTVVHSTNPDPWWHCHSWHRAWLSDKPAFPTVPSGARHESNRYAMTKFASLSLLTFSSDFFFLVVGLTGLYTTRLIK